jgi:hypothetical protein
LSTQQILGVVGGVVGAFFGYPQLGFVVGSLVGGLLTPGEKTEGPRVDDLKVQVSTYGAGIPILYGTERVGGNVVWSTDKIETEETTGGKGAEPEHTSYRYFVHMGIVLCETPRDGSTVNIVQIYQDGKLIFDARSGIPIGSALASAENPHAFFVLYQGHADQLPDPIEELYEDGPGSVPAYRGLVRIRMNAVECPGGRVPQFSFVLTTTPAVLEQTVMETTGDASGYVQADGTWSFDTDVSTFRTTISWSSAPGSLSKVFEVDLGTPFVNFSSPFAVQGATAPTLAYAIGTPGSPAQDEVRLIDVSSGQKLILHTEDFSDLRTAIGTGARPHAAFDPATNSYAITRGAAALDVGMTILPTLVECDMTGINPVAQIAFYDGVVYALNVVGGLCSVVAINSFTGVQIGTFAEPGGAAAFQEGCGISADAQGIKVFIYEGEQSRVYAITFFGLTSGTPSAVWETLAAEVQLQPPGSSPSIGPSSNFLSMAHAAVIGPNSDGEWTFVRYETVSPSEIPVSSIISELCERAGENRFDVSGVPSSDTLIGYKLQNPASARSNIDPLLTAFAIYIVDEDGVIKFKKYEDIASEAIIGYDELGQAEDGSEPADAMPLNRAQEIDMPRSVSVSYIDPAFDYQTATERSVRQITEATEDLIIELPIATNSNHGKSVADMVMFAKWRAQNTRSFKTSRKYSFLSPGDGVTVEYPRGTSRLWRITSMTDTGVLCEFNVEPGDAELYTQTSVGATGYVGQQVTPLASPTRLQLLDIPILRDQDNNAGIYAALDNLSDGWTGAELFVGYSDSDLPSRGTVSADAPIGFAETVLGSASSGFVDESNLVTVNIINNDFASVTRDVLLANGGEFWACGVPGRWEIGASATGDSLGDGRYILSRHLRGLFGTEANAGLHQAGDTFVLLRIAGMLRPAMGVGDIGQSQRYRAVSKGRSFKSAPSQNYTNTGEGLKPLSPVNLRRSNTNDLSVDRRSRLAMNNSTGALPLGETTEAWAWEFYTTSGFTTLIGTALTNTSTVTAAQIAAAGATPSGTLYVRVSQISDSVGRGHELQATI